MNIFDCHLHIEKGLEDYDLEVASGNVIYNSIDSYKENYAKANGFHKSLILDYKNNFEFCLNEGQEKRIVAFKIHSRIQKIREIDYPSLAVSISCDNKNLPIIYDAFYFGRELQFQPSLAGLIHLIESHPNRNFIVAHAGGYEILKYFFHLREYKNVGFDLSLSLQYLKDSSCESDLIKLIRYTDVSKLFFGSDFYFASPKIQFNYLVELCQKAGKSSDQIEEIASTNWLNFVIKG